MKTAKACKLQSCHKISKFRACLTNINFDKLLPLIRNNEVQNSNHLQSKSFMTKKNKALKERLR